jgi:alkanesulfonate monooxygenase SsuD/methylene tetrahydromethanopterin reductase-like flavin-dependent oxidoreductase (luciferase family)
MTRLRFCAYQYQHLPLDALTERWHEAERRGFDALWNCDTLVEPDRPQHMMFDGPATLTLMAERTQVIRIGTLVTSLYFRHPATVAKAATTLDHLSGGRLEIALGVGDPSAGAAAVGIQWRPAQAVARFAEFVRAIDQLLTHEVSDFHGEYFTCTGAETIPLPVQRPRPPLTIAAHGPKMLAIAARHADGWSQWGGYDVITEDDFYRVTAERCRRFDDLCIASDRDPTTIWHSVVCFPPLTPWESSTYFEDMVGRLRDVGIDDFVLYWPGSWRPEALHEPDVFDTVTSQTIPALRAGQ